MLKYDELKFKMPVESDTYREDSEFVVSKIIGILDGRMAVNDNKIILNTNLKAGLPLKDINKLAGPLIEAWAFEIFAGIRDDDSNVYSLINAEAQGRLDMADIILQFRKGKSVLTGNIDVKATSDDITKSGRSPNITSSAGYAQPMLKTLILCP